MGDERTAEGVEHLQQAAKELVAAARSFLDVVEEVVEDPNRFAATASSLVETLRDGLGTLAQRPADAPWAASAWTSPPRGADDDDSAAAGEQRPAPSATAERDQDTEDARDASTRPVSTRRVRRIAVD